LLVGAFERAVAPDRQPVVAADRGESVFGDAPRPGGDLPVVEPRRDLDLHLCGAVRALDHADDLAAGLLAGLADCQAVEHAHAHPIAVQRGLEHHRVLQVFAVAAGLAGDANRAVPAALDVEQPREAAAAVKARQAAPVDRGFARHERGPVTIADEAVVADRRLLRRAHRARSLML